MLKSEIKIIVTGGGSGGHISVAKSLIDSLIQDFNIPSSNIMYVGGDLGMEGEKKGNSLEQKQFKDSQFNTTYIRAGKLQRAISFKSLSLLFRSILGFFDSLKIVKSFNPTLIISSGGFVSVPVCIAGYLNKKPVYLHEQTATVGLSNRIVGKFTKRIYISFLSSAKYFQKEKTLHVGNVVRKEIFIKNINERTDKEIISLMVTNKQLPLIYISGGSLGSHSINTKVFESLSLLLKKYRILLQTGDNEIYKDYEKGISIKNNLITEEKDRLVIKKYIDSNSIGYVLNNMDYFVGRSGANTVYEIGVLKKYALFIPIPWVTHNEQYLNAKVLNDIGTANILEEKYLDQCNLSDEINKLQEQIKLRNVDTEKLNKLFPVNAVSTILQDILSSYLR